MVLWIGILFGVVFAWVAVKLRLYASWALFVNIVISVYLGVFFGPVIYSSSFLDNIYGVMLAVAGTTIAVFLILQATSYTLFTGQFTVSYPKIIDAGCSAILGFFAGNLIWAFLILAFCVTPFSSKSFGKTIGLCSGENQSDTSALNWWCDKADILLSSPDNTSSAEEIVNAIIKETDKRIHRKNNPPRPAPKPAPVKIEAPKKKALGPPPVPDIEDF